MNPLNILSILEIIDTLIVKASDWSALIRTARAEGRDVTDAEILTLAGKDDAARAALDAAIKAAGG